MNRTPTFDEAWKKHYNMVRSICLRITHNPDDADDLTQEVFLQLHRKIHLFRGDSQFSTWLYRIAVNTVLMTLRGKKTILLSLDEIKDNEDDPGQVAYQKAILFNDAALRSVADRATVMMALDALPAGYRTMLILHDIEGMEHNEIADVLGITISCSKSRLFQARHMMAKLLGAPEPQPETSCLDNIFARLEQYVEA